MHQIAQLKKSLGVHATNHPSKAHGFATCKFANLKKNVGPLLSNPGTWPLKLT